MDNQPLDDRDPYPWMEEDHDPVAEKEEEQEELEQMENDSLSDMGEVW